MNHTEDYASFFLRELDREAPVTAKMLERVPDDKFDWKPHEKSTMLGTLAAHLSTLPRFVSVIFESDSLAIESFRSPASPKSREELLETFSSLLNDARKKIGQVSADEFDKTWEMTFNGKAVISMRKADVLQTLFFNHSAHHRAQLGVYLRLLDIPVPGTYGPSADEQ